MENLIALFLALCCILPSASCKTVTVSEIEVRTFSFTEASEKYQQNEPGVRSDGFQNTSVFPINNAQDAIKRARIECTVGYDTTDVYYDDTADMWMVSFSMAGYLGGDQSVYLDSDDITHLIVYGE